MVAARLALDVVKGRGLERRIRAERRGIEPNGVSQFSLLCRTVGQEVSVSQALGPFCASQPVIQS